MALLPAGIKARSPPSGCLPPSEICPVLLIPFLPSLTSAAVPAPARRVPQAFASPHLELSHPKYLRGLPLHSVPFSAQKDLYCIIFSPFSLALKKKSFTHIVHLFLDSYK